MPQCALFYMGDICWIHIPKSFSLSKSKWEFIMDFML